MYDSGLQKVGAQLEASKPAPQIVLNVQTSLAAVLPLP